MPSRWLPWPGKRIATRRRRPRRGRPRSRPVRARAGPPGAGARRGPSPGNGRCRGRSLRGRRPRSRRAGPAGTASAASVRADTSQGTTAGSGADGGCSVSSGACSTMTCALVPLMPKDDTPARRGRPAGCHGVCSVSSSTAPSVQSTCEVGSPTCRVRGITPWRRAITVLMNPAIPAAAWAWPMFDLREPSRSGWPGGRSCPYVASSACASIGSPSLVPVPWASTGMSTSAARSPASASAWRITRSCDRPFGEVRPLEAPSWLVALPRRTVSSPVAAGPRVGEPFQDDDAGPLGPGRAVRAVGERLAASVGGQPTLAGVADESHGGGHHRDTAGQRHRALPRAQRARRPVQGDQRGGGSGVDGDRGTFEAEGVGEPPGGDGR